MHDEEDDDHDHHHNQRELQDTKAQLHLLQTRYDHLEAKARAQTELQQGSFDQLEDYNKQIRRLRGVLQDLQSDKIAAEARAANLDEKESELRELREQNANYESKIKTLVDKTIAEAKELRESTTTVCSSIWKISSGRPNTRRPSRRQQLKPRR